MATTTPGRLHRGAGAAVISLIALASLVPLATTVFLGAVLAFAASDTATAWELRGVPPRFGEILPAP